MVSRSIASLVPIKEREILVLGRPGADEPSLAPAIARAVAAYRAAGVVSLQHGAVRSAALARR